MSKLSVPEVAHSGKGCLAHAKAYVEAAVKHTRIVDLCGQKMPIVNVTYEGGSEVAARLLEKHPHYPVVAIWFEREDGKIHYGLRSLVTGDVDCSILAKRFGGGGHKTAAGFITDRPVHLKPLVYVPGEKLQPKKHLRDDYKSAEVCRFDQNSGRYEILLDDTYSRWYNTEEIAKDFDRVTDED